MKRLLSLLMSAVFSVLVVNTDQTSSAFLSVYETVEAAEAAIEADVADNRLSVVSTTEMHQVYLMPAALVAISVLMPVITISRFCI